MPFLLKSSFESQGEGGRSTRTMGTDGRWYDETNTPRVFDRKPVTLPPGQWAEPCDADGKQPRPKR